MKNTKKFYLGCRTNPQLIKPYYKMYGQLSVTAAKKKEKAVYGSMRLESFETEQEYNAKIESLKEAGYHVTTAL